MVAYCSLVVLYQHCNKAIIIIIIIIISYIYITGGCATDFVSELEAIRRQVIDVDDAASAAVSSSPIVVHCSAGVGRTGVVILVAIMKASLEHNQVSYLQFFVRQPC